MTSATRSVSDNTSPRLAGPLETLTNLARLQDNWDGYGSPPLRPVALKGAIHVLLASDIENPPAPYVGPVTGGGVQMEWRTPTRELELEILPDGSVEYVTVGEQGRMMDGTLPSYSDDHVLDLIRWLTHKTSSVE